MMLFLYCFCLRGTLHWIELAHSCQFSLSGKIAYMAKYPNPEDSLWGGIA
jgi:hypothetical protein